jgi:hypothetical protein
VLGHVRHDEQQAAQLLGDVAHHAPPSVGA